MWVRRTVFRVLLVLEVCAVALGLGAPAEALVYDDRPEPGWGVNGRVYATAIVGDTYFVGGAFSAAVAPNGSQVARRNLAAFDLATGDLLTDWRVDANGEVRTLATNGTWLYVGGAFSTLDGMTHVRLGRVSVAGGVVDTGFTPRPSATVRVLALSGSRLYVGGHFRQLNGVTVQRVAKVDSATGALDGRFSAPASYNVLGLAYRASTDTLYVSGSFDRLGPVARRGVGGVDGSTGAPKGPVMTGSVRPTLALALSDDGTRLFAAGGSFPNVVVAWSTSTGDRLWQVVTMGDNQAITHHDGVVYVGFHDGYQRNRTTKMLAINAVTGAVDPAFRPVFNRFWGVFAISVSAGWLVAGGDFTSVDGVRAHRVVRFPAR